MRVVISIARHEVAMAHRFFDWVNELGGTQGHSLSVLPAAGVDVKDILPKARRAFNDKVDVLTDYEGTISDWQKTERVRSAAGPNSAFRQVVYDSIHFKKGGFFWCELDCIPLRKDWLDRLESEYRTCGKPFMGANVKIQGVPEHMSGCAVYPQNIPDIAGKLVIVTLYTCDGHNVPTELAFDVAGADDVLHQAHFTNLIQHIFRHPGFKSREEFDSTIDSNAVVFHSCKDGSIYPYLRQNLDMGRVVAPYIEEWKNLRNNLSGGLHAVPPPQAQEEIPSRPTADSAQNSFPVTKGENSGALAGDAPKSGTNSWYGVNEGVRPPERMEAPIDAGLTVTNRTFSTSPELAKVILETESVPMQLPKLAPPWKDREASEIEVKMLCEALALFCKAPAYKARVRKALREVKIIM